jgi:hypothetical protein
MEINRKTAQVLSWTVLPEEEEEEEKMNMPVYGIRICVYAWKKFVSFFAHSHCVCVPFSSEVT